MISATTDFRALDKADFVVICVPTPLDARRQPDISYVESSVKSVAEYLRKGMMVVLESTTYPGTTEELVKPILESTGLKSGKDFYLGFSPERVDPGNAAYNTQNIPKVVGGHGADATELISSMYEAILDDKVFRVSSPAVAEMSKMLENSYRNVNIGLINEFAVFCNEIGIDIWEVIDAAKTKPFGFTPFYPGPGLGGHCIPVDPCYLNYKASAYNFRFSTIEASMEINDNMPVYCVKRIEEMLGRRFGKPLKGSRILILGVAYKPLEKLVLAFDAQWTGWSAYKSLDIEFLSETLAPFNQYIEKNYSNSWTFHLGAQYDLTNRFQVRAGMMVDTTPVSKTHYNPETPGMTKIEHSVGFSFSPVRNFSIDASLLYVVGLGEDGASCTYYDLLLKKDMTFTANYKVHAWNPSIGFRVNF